MRAKRRQALIIKEVRFSPADDDVSRRKISEVFRLLLRPLAAESADKKNQPPPDEFNRKPISSGHEGDGPHGEESELPPGEGL